MTKEEPKEKVKKVKKRKYYAKKRSSYICSMPVFDEKGEPLIQRDKFGNLRIRKDGTPMYTKRDIEFAKGQGLVKFGTYCIYETSDPQEIQHLDNRVSDGSSCVVTEEMWKKERNAAAYEMELKFEEAQEQKLAAEKELEELKNKGAAEEDIIKRLKEQVAELKKGK